MSRCSKYAPGKRSTALNGTRYLPPQLCAVRVFSSTSLLLKTQTAQRPKDSSKSIFKQVEKVPKIGSTTVPFINVIESTSKQPSKPKTPPPKQVSKKRAPPPPKTSTSPLPKSVYQSPVPVLKYTQRTSYTQTLLQKDIPTILFTAPSYTSFKIATQSQALFCFFYAGYNYTFMSLYAPADIATWVPPTYAGVCFLMALAGGYLCLGPLRLIKKITAIPTAMAYDEMARKMLNSGRPTQNIHTEQRGLGKPELRIMFEMEKFFPVPFTNPRTVLVRPEHIELPKPVGTQDLATLLSVGDLRAQQWVEEQHEQRRRLEAQPWWKKPFTKVSQGLYYFVQAFGRVWTKAGFVDVKVKGRTFALKMDMRDGKALERGYAMDKLFRIRNQTP